MSEAEAAAGDSAPTVLYEQPSERVARVVLNRPEVANAQSYEMLYALNDAFDRDTDMSRYWASVFDHHPNGVANALAAALIADNIVR